MFHSSPKTVCHPFTVPSCSCFRTLYIKSLAMFLLASFIACTNFYFYECIHMGGGGAFDKNIAIIL